jgi:hypothetical protein
MPDGTASYLSTTIVVDNTTNYNFLDDAIDRTYQLLLMIRTVTGVELKIRLLTIYPNIVATTYDTSESILSFLNRIPRVKRRVPTPTTDTVNDLIDRIGKGQDIIFILDELCLFKKEYITETCEKNSVVLAMYQSMRYDRDIHFYEARNAKVLRFKDSGRLYSYEEMIEVLRSDSISDRIKTIRDVIITPSYIETLDTVSNHKTNMENRPDRIDTEFIPYILRIFRLENLIEIIDTGYTWRETDVISLKYSEIVENDLSDSDQNESTHKQRKITIKMVIDHCFRELSAISEEVVQTYLMRHTNDSDSSEYDLSLHTNYCRYRLSALLTRIDAYTKHNQYSGPTYHTPTDSDSDSDSDSDEDSVNINITQIGKTWRRFETFRSAHLMKKIDLNLPSALKQKIEKIVEDREDQIDRVEDEFDAIANETIKPFYTSTLTLRSWVDALRSGNSIGMNMDLDIQSHHKSRYNVYLNSSPKLMGTTSEFFDGIRTRGFTDIQTNNHCLDGVFGDSNVILPIFITNLNWKVAKHYVDPICNMIVNNSHLITDPNAWKIYYTILVDFFSTIICNTKFDRDSVRRYLVFWFTAYNLTRDRKVLNINGYLRKAIKNNYELGVGMIGGQALTLIGTAAPLTDKIIDHCLKMKVRELKNIMPDDILDGEYIYDMYYTQIFRLMSFQTAMEVFQKFFEEVMTEKELVKHMVRNYSIVSDQTIDAFIRIMNQTLEAHDRESRSRQMIERIDLIITENTLSDYLKNEVRTLGKTDQKTEKNPAIHSMLVQFD